jgi:hypothetical protein
MDKRNLYLANEGLAIDKIDSGDADAGPGMSADDRKRREKAQAEKRKKLVNPLFFVSAHRLSIRNLSKNVTDQELKTLCIKALQKGMQTVEVY